MAWITVTPVDGEFTYRMQIQNISYYIDSRHVADAPEGAKTVIYTIGGGPGSHGIFVEDAVEAIDAAVAVSS